MPAESDQITTLLIDGEAVVGAGAAIAVENPYTTETIVEVPAASRCELLHEVARRLREDTEPLARAMTAEGGKPLLENRDELEWTRRRLTCAPVGRLAAFMPPQPTMTE